MYTPLGSSYTNSQLPSHTNLPFIQSEPQISNAQIANANLQISDANLQIANAIPAIDPNIPLNPQAQQKAKNMVELVEKAVSERKTCDFGEGAKFLTLGADLLTSGNPELYSHNLVRLGRPVPGVNNIVQGQGPIYIQARQYQSSTNPTPMWDTYNADLFKTPIDRTDNKVSMGLVTNAWTGETFEAFEDAMPAPTTDKYRINPDQLKHTNPRLVWLNGGIDPNMPLPSKTEVCQDLPGIDAGKNVWGPQLYAERIRQRQAQNAMRQVWLNRDGDMPTERSMFGERPVGFVGLQNMMRFVPSLPPTQQLDLKDWMPTPDATFLHNPKNEDLVKSTTFLRKNDLSCERFGPVSYIEGQQAAPIMPEIILRPTWRGAIDGTITGIANLQTSGNQLINDQPVRATLKGLMSETFPTQLASLQDAGSYVILDDKAKATLKGLMDMAPPSQQAYLQGVGQMIINGTIPKATLKELMSQILPTLGAHLESSGGQLINNQIVPATLKELMMLTFPTGPANIQQTGQQLVNDRVVPATLKGLMSETFPTMPVNIQQTGQQLVNDQTVPATLKGLMSETFPTMPVNVQQTGQQLVNDQTVPATLKGLMSETFPTLPANLQNTAHQLDFQGELNNTKRMFYSDKTRQPGAEFLTANSVGPGFVNINQCRGTTEIHHVALSHELDGTGGTLPATRGISQHDRHLLREQTQFNNHLPMANATFMSEAVIPRMTPQVRGSCNSSENLDNYLYNYNLGSGFNYHANASW